MPKSPICFVDLETTGMNSYQNRVIEVGIVKVHNNKVVREYNQLINPEKIIDPFIQKLTGIYQNDLDRSPTFSQVAKDILEILEDSIFVAHNVRFDYGFLRREFKNLGFTYKSKHFDTIKLARLLFPNLTHYNLDSIIANFGIKCDARHRALEDAKVLWDFFKLAKKKTKKDIFESSLDIALKKPSIPRSLTEEYLDDLPDTAGVYIFYGEDSTPLYIRKSVNIRDRVMSHFTNDYMSSMDMRISRQVKRVETIETAGELGALLTESNLIKKLKPLYNRMHSNLRKLVVLLKSQENNYYSLEQKNLEEVGIEDLERVVGIFKSRKQIKEHLWEKAKKHSLCPKLLNLEKTKKNCLYTQLQYCKGACVGDEPDFKYNVRFIEAFSTSKIKPWKWEKPIIIKEHGEKEELFVVDKWCFLGTLKTEADSLEELNRDYSFDFDTYKILSKFIFNLKNQDKIKILS